MTSTTETVDTECCAPDGCCSGCCCNRCCCNMPHGKVVLFPSIVLSIAAAVSMITLVNCNFVVGVNDPYYGGYSYAYAGFWQGCIYYSSSGSEQAHQDDTARKVAMSFGLLACIVGTAAMCTLWPITCKHYNATMKWTVFGLVLFALVSQLLTFSMFATEYCSKIDCKLGWGGGMSVAAAILYVVSAIGVVIIPVHITEHHRQGGGGDGRTTSAMQETTETVQLDGTRVTETVTTNPDGSKTIKRTIVRPNVGIEEPFTNSGNDVAAAHAVAVVDEP